MTYEEREVKFYLQDLPALADRLHVCGAELTRERTFETNLRLDMPDRSLAKAGRILRLRKDSQTIVTYKADARFESGVTARTEIEFVADDFLTARKLFEALGYEAVVVYEKYRRVYQMGVVEVALDELPYGDFVEIEAVNDTLIEGVAQMLGLNWSKSVEANYLGLFEIVKKNASLAVDNLTFKNFEGIDISPQFLEVEPADR